MPHVLLVAAHGVFVPAWQPHLPHIILLLYGLECATVPRKSAQRGPSQLAPRVICPELRWHRLSRRFYLLGVLHARLAQ